MNNGGGADANTKEEEVHADDMFADTSPWEMLPVGWRRKSKWQSVSALGSGCSVGYRLLLRQSCRVLPWPGLMRTRSCGTEMKWWKWHSCLPAPRPPSHSTPISEALSHFSPSLPFPSSLNVPLCYLQGGLRLLCRATERRR